MRGKSVVEIVVVFVVMKLFRSGPIRFWRAGMFLPGGGRLLSDLRRW